MPNTPTPPAPEVLARFDLVLDADLYERIDRLAARREVDAEALASWLLMRLDQLADLD